MRGADGRAFADCRSAVDRRQVTHNIRESVPGLVFGHSILLKSNKLLVGLDR